MEVEKVVIQVGNETDKPKAGDKVTITFTGWLYDPHRASNGYRGKQYALTLNLVGSDC
jgi:FK506-binding protein 1